MKTMTGRMWIGSEYDGITVGSPGSWTVLTEKDGLAGYEVKVMTQDPDGNYWLGHEQRPEPDRKKRFTRSGTELKTGH